MNREAMKQNNQNNSEKDQSGRLQHQISGLHITYIDGEKKKHCGIGERTDIQINGTEWIDYQILVICVTYFFLIGRNRGLSIFLIFSNMRSGLAFGSNLYFIDFHYDLYYFFSSA